MNTLTKAETVEAKASTRLGRLRNRFATLFATLAALIVVPVSAASASTYTDPTQGAGDGFIDGLKDYFLNEVVTKALGLMVVVVSISVLVAWGRKAIKSR